MTKLLVVDDNKENLYMAEVLLSGSGYQVELAANGAEALEKARKDPPDMIIADILMPVMDGFTLCREWRLDDKLRSIPFIFYTATYTDPEDEKFALNLGADRFIVKPIEPDALVDIIGEVLIKYQNNGPALSGLALPDEDVYLRQYNQALINKLEDKLAQLEESKQKLEKEIRERKLTEEKMKGLESQLVQLQKMEAIGTLAGGIAHDFNNILLAIMGYAEIALLDIQEGKSNKGHIQELLKACYRAKDLVTQILTFSRQTDMDRKPIQVKSIVKEALKLLRSSLPSTIEIRQKLESESLVLANPTQIYQVMMNLCTNAGQAMGDSGGTINVSLIEVELDEYSASLHHELSPGLYQKLEVSDNGKGMTSEQLTRIFEPYFTTRKEGGGTGLGLSVVYGIVKETGGAITVHSKLNKGAQFDVFFPIVKGDDITKSSALEMPEGGKEHILFVDDEPALIEIGVQFLEKLGYQVTAFRDSKTALQIFKGQKDIFDLVITDMTMPGLTGIMMTQELLKVRSDIPVILCTGFGDKITEKKAEEMGIKAFLMKPFVIQNLSRTIRQVLDSK